MKYNQYSIVFNEFLNKPIEILRPSKRKKYKINKRVINSKRMPNIYSI